MCNLSHSSNVTSVKVLLDSFVPSVCCYMDEHRVLSAIQHIGFQWNCPTSRWPLHIPTGEMHPSCIPLKFGNLLRKQWWLGLHASLLIVLNIQSRSCKRTFAPPPASVASFPHLVAGIEAFSPCSVLVCFLAILSYYYQ